jgi:hypothetical protein
MYLNVWLKDMASILLLSRNIFWTNSASYEYKNKSANKGAQLAPIGYANGLLEICIDLLVLFLDLKFF